MSRKDFELIAAVIRNLAVVNTGDPPGKQALSEADHKRVRNAFAKALRENNDRFDMSKFIAACTE